MIHTRAELYRFLTFNHSRIHTDYFCFPSRKKSTTIIVHKREILNKQTIKDAQQVE